MKKLLLIAAVLCLGAFGSAALGKAKKTSVVVTTKPVLSGSGPDKKTLSTAGHLVTAKSCQVGRKVVLLRTDQAGNIAADEGEVASTLTTAGGKWTLSGELKSAPKTDDRLLVNVKKKRRANGRLLCRGARSELLTIG